MSDKRATNLSNESIDVKDTLSIENINIETIEEYKTLNEKCDKVIVKIKNRKASSERKK